MAVCDSNPQMLPKCTHMLEHQMSFICCNHTPARLPFSPSPTNTGRVCSAKWKELKIWGHIWFGVKFYRIFSSCAHTHTHNSPQTWYDILCVTILIKHKKSWCSAMLQDCVTRNLFIVATSYSHLSTRKPIYSHGWEFPMNPQSRESEEVNIPWNCSLAAPKNTSNSTFVPTIFRCVCFNPCNRMECFVDFCHYVFFFGKRAKGVF